MKKILDRDSSSVVVSQERGGRPNYEFLDGIRGIAIVMVVLCHTIYLPEGKGGALERGVFAFFAAGWMGVPIFFVLSGFLISLPFWKLKWNGGGEVLPAQFFQRRFWKIYPPLVVSVLMLTPIYIHWKGDWNYLWYGGVYLSGLPFLKSFFGSVGNEFNPVMWSLLVEVQFYLTLPLLFWVTRRVSYEKALWGLPALIYLGTMALGLWRVNQGGAFFPTTDPVLYTGYPVSLFCFPLGIFVGGLVQSGKLMAILGGNGPF